MTEQPKRMRFMEPTQAPRTPQEARQRRSTRMIGIGAMALVWALLVAALGGAAVAGILIGLLGIGLLVGGLVIRR